MVLDGLDESEQADVTDLAIHLKNSGSSQKGFKEGSNVNQL